ncbi:hypothetical protein NDU88_006990 [Pleurodeles waltl]|uniref:Uncharacterized protein n=1 Tax=Pleurodeles waltl TaxID=8319 RepID=A0AAV7NWQ9_PLEWA|nr:hypothetical protein NDU88_006990 [Pleurodeles waltl]
MWRSPGTLAGTDIGRRVTTSARRSGECNQDLGAPSRMAWGDEKTTRKATTAVRFVVLSGWAGDCAGSETQHFVTCGLDRSALRQSGAVACTTAQSPPEVMSLPVMAQVVLQGPGLSSKHLQLPLDSCARRGPRGSPTLTYPCH